MVVAEPGFFCRIRTRFSEKALLGIRVFFGLIICIFKNFLFLLLRLSHTKMVKTKLFPDCTLLVKLLALLFTEPTDWEPILFWIWLSLDVHVPKPSPKKTNQVKIYYMGIGSELMVIEKKVPNFETHCLSPFVTVLLCINGGKCAMGVRNYVPHKKIGCTFCPRLF